MPVAKQCTPRNARWERYFETYAAARFPEKLAKYPWNYKHDLCMLGLDALYNATGNPVYQTAVLDARRFLLHENGQIRNFDTQEHNLDKISFGKSLRLLYRYTGDARFQAATAVCFQQLLKHPRTESGGFIHKDIYPQQIWLDGLYMALPFYAAFEGEDRAQRFADILQQFSTVRERLYVPGTGLYLHAWDESRSASWANPTTGTSPTHWLRAEGWFLMALCDCFELLHSQTPNAGLLAQLLSEALDGLIPYRDTASGMYLQVPDRADVKGNYPETSGSAMVAYAMLKGARLGMIGSRYTGTGKALLDAIGAFCLRDADSETHLYNICASAGLGPGPHKRSDRDGTVRYYLSERQSPDNQHGAGACMLAYAQALRADGET